MNVAACESHGLVLLRRPALCLRRSANLPSSVLLRVRGIRCGVPLPARIDDALRQGAIIEPIQARLVARSGGGAASIQCA